MQSPSRFLGVQLAASAAGVPTSDRWLFEQKYDGYRAQVVLAGDEVRVFTRSGCDWTQQFRSVAESLRLLRCDSAVIDGEICAVDGTGRTNFTQLCGSLRSGQPLTFFAFDLLELNGRDLTGLPLHQRKMLLQMALAPATHGGTIQLVPFVTSGAAQLLEEMSLRGCEGIVAKRLDAPYRSNERSAYWLKIKCTKRQEFVVVGWRPDAASGAVRSLVLATFEESHFVYRGRVGAGFTHQARQDLRSWLTPLGCDLSPLGAFPRELKAHTRWVQPTLLAEVAFQEITPHGVVRHPAYLGLRQDKPATNVHLELPSGLHRNEVIATRDGSPGALRRCISPH